MKPPGGDITAAAAEYGRNLAMVWTFLLVLAATAMLGALIAVSPVLAFAAAAATVAAWFFIRYRKFGILTVFFLVPLGPLLWISPEGTISAQKLLIAGLTGAWIVQVLLLKDRTPFHEFTRTRLNTWVLLFLVVFLIPLPWCRDLNNAMLYIVRWVSHIMLLYFLVFNVRSFAFFRKCLAAVLVVGVLISIIAIWEQFSQKSILEITGRDIQLIKGEETGKLISSKFKTIKQTGEPEWARSMATFKGPNELGFFIVFCSGLALYFILRPSALWRRLLAVFVLLLLILALNDTGSRGALGGFFVLVGVLILLSRFPLKGIIITAFLISIVIYLASPGTGGTQWRGGLNWQMIKHDERNQWAEISVDMFLDYPVAGIGLAQFEKRLFEYRVRNMQKYVSAPHNIFLQIGAENGILGLLLLFFMIYAVFREMWQFRAQPLERDHRLLGSVFLATFAGMLTFSLTSNVVLDETFWTFLSLVAIASCLYSTASEEEIVAEPLEAADKDLLVVILPRP